MTARPGMPDLPAPDFHSSLTGKGRWTEPAVTAYAEAAYDAGRKAERDAVMAWLREQLDSSGAVDGIDIYDAADAIQRGEHLPGADS